MSTTSLNTKHIESIIKSVESPDLEDKACDKNVIYGLYELIEKSYSLNPSDKFLKIYLDKATREIDKSPRATTAKGMLRYAFEKYLQYKASILPEKPHEVPYALSNLVFGSSKKASVVKFWISRREVHYDFVIHPQAMYDFLWKVSRTKRPIRSLISFFTTCKSPLYVSKTFSMP